ncbi:MAG TPA: AMP-binding protein [Acidimicrobiales bacterium]|nr:AMP-binding protein [Acidimicrobiales bacterium]
MPEPGERLLGDRSLPRRLAVLLATEQDRPLLYDDRTGWLSRGEVEERSRRLAGELCAAGLQRGDRFVVSAAPSTGLAIVHLAALRLGLVVVPMNTAYTGREIAHVVSDSRPAGAAADDRARLELVDAAPPGRQRKETGGRGFVRVMLGVATGRFGAAIEGRVPRRSSGEPRLDEAESDDPALIVYTSGTTGSPKGALLSHGNLLASAEALRRAWRWTEEDRLVLPLPLFHVHGLAVGLQGTLASGGSVVLRPRFDASDVGDAVERHSATMLFGVPTMYSRLASELRLRRLRLAVSGSAPLPADLHRRFEAATGQQILERYGMTETLMIASNPYDGERRPGTVGFALPGVDLRLDEGEILVRGPNVFSGYFDRPEATAAAFDDGWFRTGDVGHFDGDGYLVLSARKSEVVITGGYNVYPREVEDVLRSHPGVADAAVVGWPDDEWGEQVVAFVVPAGDAAPSEGELGAYAAGQLAGYKRPRRIIAVPELPRNALGKVVKSELGPPRT